MKQIKLLFLLASASVTGAFAQSNGKYRNRCRTLDEWILGRAF